MKGNNFHPQIIAAILDRVTKWFFPRDIYPEPHNPPPECIQMAIDAQTSIGWGKNFLRGFVVTQWADANAIMHDTRHDTPKITLLGAALVRPCLTYFLKCWIECNAALHGGTKEEQESKQQILHNHCIDVYAEASKRILRRDWKILFLHKASAIKKMTPARQRNWLAFAHAFLPQALQHYQARQDTGQTHITQYFIELYNPNGIPTEPDNDDTEPTPPAAPNEDSEGAESSDGEEDDDSDKGENEFVEELADIELDPQLGFAESLQAYFNEFDARNPVAATPAAADEDENLSGDVSQVLLTAPDSPAAEI